MKGYRFINTMQSIASFMAGFETDRISYGEYNTWCEYLQKALTTKEYRAIVYYGNRYLEELKREDDGFLFDIGDYSIKLAKGRTKEDLDKYVLDYVEVDVVLKMLDAVEKFKRIKKREEVSL